MVHELPLAWKMGKQPKRGFPTHAATPEFVHHKELGHGIIRVFARNFLIVIHHGKTRQLAVHPQEKGPAVWFRPVAIEPIIAIQAQGVHIGRFPLTALIEVFFQQVAKNLFFVHRYGDQLHIHMAFLPWFQYITPVPRRQDATGVSKKVAKRLVRGRICNV